MGASADSTVLIPLPVNNTTFSRGDHRREGDSWSPFIDGVRVRPTCFAKITTATAVTAPCPCSIYIGPSVKCVDAWLRPCSSIMTTTRQPGAIPRMNVNIVYSGGGDRNSLGKPADKDGQREWSHGLCDCFGDCGTCVTSWFCPCITWSRNKTRMMHFENRGVPHPDGGEKFGGECAMHGLLCVCGLGWILQIGTRGSVRNRYYIAGSCFGDCMTALCCSACELTQESREIELEEKSMMRQSD